MVSLFDNLKDRLVPKQGEELTPEQEIAMAFQEEAQMRQQENIYVQPQAPPINQLEQTNQILTPSQIEDKYHLKLVKEMMLSQIDKTEVPIIRRYIGLIFQFAYDGVDEMADILHAEMMGRLMVYRSVNGFQQIVLGKTTQEIHRISEVQTKPNPKDITR